MSIAADALQRRLISGLINSSGRTPITHLGDVITNSAPFGYDLDFDSLSSTITLDFREPQYLSAAYRNDASRFATASFASLFSIRAALEDERSFAWGLIKLYYAAFYSGHALLRFVGTSCTSIDSRHITRIKTLTEAYGLVPGFEITSGLYKCDLNNRQSGFLIRKVGGKNGGTHEIFWETFNNLLSEVANEALLHLAPDDGKAVFSKIETLRKILKRGAGGSWLSSVRNDIQYRQDFGVWPPVSLNDNRRGLLSRLAILWMNDPMDVPLGSQMKNDLEIYVASCALIVGMCRSLVERINELCARKNSSFTTSLLRLCVE